jgi:tetratricopeptide (TPR) repeat protein
MSSLSNVRLPKPKDWQDFERKTRDLFAHVLADPNTRMHGRTGQPQHGVDIWGYRKEDLTKLVGVQCKLSNDEIAVAELKIELQKAKSFIPAISEFCLVTTAARDVKIQQAARELTQNLSKTARPIRVEVWGWDDIEEATANYADAWKIFDPTFNPFAEQALDEARVGFRALQDHLEEIDLKIDSTRNPENVSAISDKVDEILRIVSQNESVPTAALRSILNAWGEADTDDVAEITWRLTAKAVEFKALTERLTRLTNDDPAVQRRRQLAVDALREGDFNRADCELAAAEALDLTQLEELEASVKRKRLSAARTRASRADAAGLRGSREALQQAAAHYEEAARLVRDASSEKAMEYVVSQCGTLLTLGSAFGERAALDMVEAKLTEILFSPTRPIPFTVAFQALMTLGNALTTAATGAGKGEQLRRAKGILSYGVMDPIKEILPDYWALAQNNIGATLTELGKLEGNQEVLLEAIDALGKALEVRAIEHSPIAWAQTQLNMGNALMHFGRLARNSEHTRQAINAFLGAQEIFSRDPHGDLCALGNLGDAFMQLRDQTGDDTHLVSASDAYRKALEIETRERQPQFWGRSQVRLGIVFLERAKLQEDEPVGYVEEAIQAFRNALLEITYQRLPFDYLLAKRHLGLALLKLARLTDRIDCLREAVVVFQATAGEDIIDFREHNWAEAQRLLGHALAVLGMVSRNRTQLDDSISAYRAAYEVFASLRVPEKLQAIEQEITMVAAAKTEIDKETT